MPAEKIAAAVTDGEVTLDGTVESSSQRADAERAVRNLSGVQAVADHLRVEPRMAPADDEIDDMRPALE